MIKSHRVAVHLAEFTGKKQHSVEVTNSKMGERAPGGDDGPGQSSPAGRGLSHKTYVGIY